MDDTSESSARSEGEPIVTFYKMYPGALPPMPADRSALGTLPTSAFRYCEAVTTASGYGWYVFPAADLILQFDGIDTYIYIDDDWSKLTSMHLPDLDDWWNSQCPEFLVDLAPPFVSSLAVPGYVQLWSGYLVKTRTDWSSNIRPLVNLHNTDQFTCFEGIVETDTYNPAPLFINFRIKATGTPIEIPSDEPLFQLQPIKRESYQANFVQSHLLKTSEAIAGAEKISDEEWQSYRGTISLVDPIEDTHETGQYGKDVRKRRKTT